MPGGASGEGVWPSCHPQPPGEQLPCPWGEAAGRAQRSPISAWETLAQRCGMAQCHAHDMAWHGIVPCSMARHGMPLSACHGTVWYHAHTTAQHGMAWHGTAWYLLAAWHDMTWHGMARHGRAGRWSPVSAGAAGGSCRTPCSLALGLGYHPVSLVGGCQGCALHPGVARGLRMPVPSLPSRGECQTHSAWHSLQLLGCAGGSRMQGWDEPGLVSSCPECALQAWPPLLAPR